MLPPIDPEKLRSCPESVKQLKDNIFKDARDEKWLREKTLSLEYDDAFSFGQLLDE